MFTQLKRKLKIPNHEYTRDTYTCLTQQMGTVVTDFSWPVHCAHASSSLNHADGYQALGFAHEKSSLRDPAGYTANCWAFTCSQFNETCCLVEMNCRSEYCPLPHGRGLITCSMLRRTAERLARAEQRFSSRTAVAAVTFLSITLALVMRTFARMCST